MKNSTTISKIMQELINEEKVKKIAEKYNYEEKARKATVSAVLQYHLCGAIEKCSSYRELEVYGAKHSGLKLDYSTLSKKSKEIPYEISLELLESSMKESNRSKRRKLSKEYNLFVRNFDTTRFIAKRKSWNWTPYKGGKNGIKVHVSYQPESGLPDRFCIGKIHVGDTSRLEDFCKDGDDASCVLADRGYFNIAKFCRLDDSGQDFVIRIRNTANLVNPVPYEFTANSRYTDILCTLGEDRGIPAEYRNHQFRVISFEGSNGKPVTLCTNIYSLTADEIADLYRMRWQVETFFKTLKQNFSLGKIFGSTMNAVFTQIIINFIAYIMLFVAFSLANFNFSFITFLRYIRCDSLSFPLVFCTFCTPCVYSTPMVFVRNFDYAFTVGCAERII